VGRLKSAYGHTLDSTDLKQWWQASTSSFAKPLKQLENHFKISAEITNHMNLCKWSSEHLFVNQYLRNLESVIIFLSKFKAAKNRNVVQFWRIRSRPTTAFYYHY